MDVVEGFVEFKRECFDLRLFYLFLVLKVGDFIVRVLGLCFYACFINFLSVLYFNFCILIYVKKFVFID